MVEYIPAFSQFFIADLCVSGVIAMTTLLIGYLLSRLLWMFAVKRGSFGDE